MVLLMPCGLDIEENVVLGNLSISEVCGGELMCCQVSQWDHGRSATRSASVEIHFHQVSGLDNEC